MLPQSQGGVVDANLRVHGLKNVRVIDASVPPIALSTHLMASTYGVAEIGAAVIREYWNGGGQEGKVAFSGGESLTNSTASSSETGSAGSSKVQKNGAVSGTGQGLRGVVSVAFMVGVGFWGFV